MQPLLTNLCLMLLIPWCDGNVVFLYNDVIDFWMCSVPGHWKGINGPSPEVSSSPSLSSFSVSLPTSWSLQWLKPLVPLDSPFSKLQLFLPRTGTSESPLSQVFVLIRRCLCTVNANTKHKSGNLDEPSTHIFLCVFQYTIKQCGTVYSAPRPSVLILPE